MLIKIRFIRILFLIFIAFLALPLAAGTPPARLDQEKLSQIDAVVNEEIAQQNIPGAVICVGQGDEVLYWKAFGDKIIEPNKEPMDKETIFDLASLAKPIATAAAVMVLADQKKIKLDDYVRTYLPAFACRGKEEVQLKHLLTHTSGLPDYTDAAALKKQFGPICPDKVIEQICSLEAMSKPGEEFRYSCLSYITLARIVETITREKIDIFTRRHIFEPLGMKHTTFNPPASWRENIAATQIVDGQPLRGVVHDPLARLMGGISGNAGLFSTADDLAIYCRMLLHDGQWQGVRVLSPSAVRLLTQEQMLGRAYGFDVSSKYSWIKGSYASAQAFCHTGYTGTSIVCDPAHKIFLIILTNCVHPHDKGVSKPLRLKVADIVFSTCP